MVSPDRLSAGRAGDDPVAIELAGGAGGGVGEGRTTVAVATAGVAGGRFTADGPLVGPTGTGPTGTGPTGAGPTGTEAPVSVGELLGAWEPASAATGADEAGADAAEAGGGLTGVGATDGVEATIGERGVARGPAGIGAVVSPTSAAFEPGVPDPTGGGATTGVDGGMPSTGECSGRAPSPLSPDEPAEPGSSSELELGEEPSVGAAADQDEPDAEGGAEPWSAVASAAPGPAECGGSAGPASGAVEAPATPDFACVSVIGTIRSSAVSYRA